MASAVILEIVKWAVFTVLVACGRIGFDDHQPVGGSGDDGAGGANDAQQGLAKDAATDAPSACANAIPLMLAVRKASSTCVGGDLIDSCGPTGTQEVVFKFTSTATNGYNFRAFDPGTMNVSNSTQQLDAHCQPMGACAGLLGISVTQGETVYVAVEAAAGGCTNIEFEVQ
jgi:hypothetical protein